MPNTESLRQHNLNYEKDDAFEKERKAHLEHNLEDFKSEVLGLPPESIYNFGNGVVDGESDIRFTKNKLKISKINAEISIESALNYKLKS